jgi:FixJ family two-component response regulator
VTDTAQPFIAVVDDEAGVRTMLRRVLRHADYEVAVFASGEDFLASLATHTPACVILDVHMPGLSGLEAHARMRSQGFAVPAIFITASEDRTLDRAVQDAGGVALLRKPFPSNGLLETVDRALCASGPVFGERHSS